MECVSLPHRRFLATIHSRRRDAEGIWISVHRRRWGADVTTEVGKRVLSEQPREISEIRRESFDLVGWWRAAGFVAECDSLKTQPNFMGERVGVFGVEIAMREMLSGDMVEEVADLG